MSHNYALELKELFPDQLPGVQFVHCKTFDCHISVENCQKRHLSREPSHFLCRRCPIGSALCKDKLSDSIWLDYRQPDRCPRCHRSIMRVIGVDNKESCLCVSCWNREHEYTTNGMSARGRPLVHFIPPRLWRVGVVVKGELRYYQLKGLDLNEALLRAQWIDDGVTFHCEHPFPTAWSDEHRRWVYVARDVRGQSHVIYSTLHERQEFFSIEPTHPGQQPAEVLQLPSFGNCDYALESFYRRIEDRLGLLKVRLDALVHRRSRSSSVPADPFRRIMPEKTWVALDIICDRCKAYPLEVKRYKTDLQCRCPACDRC
ncbi:hypothetical protein ID007_004341 [Salmonella enterica]|nr:hypothetical protein [Salmonella enterica]